MKKKTLEELTEEHEQKEAEARIQREEEIQEALEVAMAEADEKRAGIVSGEIEVEEASVTEEERQITRHRDVVIGLDELLRINLPPVTYILDGLIPEKGISYCFGAPKSSKSQLMMHIGLICACGGLFLEQHKHIKSPDPCRILYIDEEHRVIGMKEKLGALARGMGVENIPEATKNFKVAISTNFVIEANESIDKLKDIIREFKPKLVIIDSIAKVFRGDENNVADVRRIFRALNNMVLEYGCSFVLIHHRRKSQGHKGEITIDDMPGSREFSAQADSVFGLQKLGKGLFKVTQVANRYGEDKESFTFRIKATQNPDGSTDQMRLVWNGTEKEMKSTKSDKMADALEKWLEYNSMDEFKTEDAKDAMKKEFGGDYSDNIFNYARKKLLGEKKIELKGSERSGQYKRSLVGQSPKNEQ